MHPILFKIPVPVIPGLAPQGGAIPVFSYGTMIALGFLCAYIYVCKMAARRGIDEEHITDLFLVIIITSIVGCRLNYVATHWEDYAHDWRSIYRLWEGGMVYLGGFIGAMVGGFGYLWLRGLPYGVYYDMFAAAVPFAAALWRVGCFLNGCCFGLPTTCALGMSFPRAPELRHPTQAYEFVILMAISVAMHFYYKKNRRPGMTMVMFGYLYSLERFAIEFIRDESLTEHYLFGLTLAQSTSLLVIAAVALVHLKLRFSGRVEAPPEELWEKQKIAAQQA